jgi:hypothetical protein
VEVEDDPGDKVRVKSSPVPAKGSVCTPLGALSVRVNAPLRAPPAVGLNVTLIVQLLPAARFVPQAFVSAKSPLAAMLVMDRAALPVLVRVTVWPGEVVPENWAANVRLSGDRLTAGPKPVALRLTDCGLPGALSVKERLPEAAPSVVGVKVTATVQDPDAATGLEIEQVVPAGAMANGPVTPMTVKVRLALPVFVTVTVCAGLVVPTDSEGKVGGADKLATAPSPVALRLTDCGLPGALSVKERLPEAAPAAVGVKVTATVQDPDAATGLAVEQVVPVGAMANGPEMLMALMVRLALPMFVTVTVCAGLVIPTDSAGKVRGADKLTAGFVPVTVTDDDLPVALL